MSEDERAILLDKYEVDQPETTDADQPPVVKETLLAYIRRKSPTLPPPWHLRKLVDVFQRASTQTVRAVVSMPPRHGKTHTARHALAWMVQTYPSLLNGLVMYGGEQAERGSNVIRRMVRDDSVELDPAAQRIGYWATTAEGGLAATGIDGALTGTGFGGLLCVDDILRGREEAESKVQREKAWDIFTANAISRMQPPLGSVVVIGTRWHTDDVIGRILEHQGERDFPVFEHINLPAIRDPRTGEPSDDGIPLWPERFPLDGPLGLHGIRAIQGPYNWHSLYQGVPRPRGGAVFKNEPGRYQVPTPCARIILSADCAGTAGDRSDYTAVCALGCVGFGDRTVCEVLEMARWRLEPQDVAPKLLEFQRRWGGGIMWIELTRDGKAIAKAIQALAPRIRLGLVVPIGDKFTRAQPVAAAWNDGRVRVPMAAGWLGDFLEEVQSFTGLGDKRDDQVDCLSQGWARAIAGSGHSAGAQTTGVARGGIY